MQKKPHNIEELNSILETNGISDESYRNLYELTNGLEYDYKYPTHAYDYCDFGVIPSIEYGISLLRNESVSRIWKNSRLPLVTSFAGDFLLLETKGSLAGQLTLYSPNLGYVDFLPTYFDSIDAMLETIITCFKQDAFVYDSNMMFLNTDYNLKFEIAKHLNPKSDYWK